MAEMASEEIASAAADMQALLAQLQAALLPRDPDDERNAFLEIRAGTGGDESALFAGDLARMYLRYCERQGWRTEVMSESASDLGGYKELVLRVEGKRVYEQLRFESGGHRVQRVPVTESQGRIHTSACTVAVMPEPEEAAEVTLNPADLRIDTFRASGAGGQHINKTDSAIRVTHLPTGLVAECQDDRSQHRNKAKALAINTLVKGHRVVLFMKGTAQFPQCGFSGRAVQVLKACGVSDLVTVNVLEDEGIRQGIKDYANWPTIPQLYVNGEFLGGSDIMMEMYQNGELQQALSAN
ncbi:hypothetical protein B566_EDAN018396 [Ephemera danica]|nr:hypothetical protein B566_EDAN018396 [Ephemera danica]